MKVDQISVVLSFLSKVLEVLWMLCIGVWALLDLGSGDFLAWKIYAMPECEGFEIGMQIHSNCMKNKNVHNADI